MGHFRHICSDIVLQPVLSTIFVEIHEDEIESGLRFLSGRAAAAAALPLSRNCHLRRVEISWWSSSRARNRPGGRVYCSIVLLYRNCHLRVELRSRSPLCL